MKVFIQLVGSLLLSGWVTNWHNTSEARNGYVRPRHTYSNYGKEE